MDRINRMDQIIDEGKNQGPTFQSVTGKITALEGFGRNTCRLLVTVEEMGEITTFVISDDTYVAEYVTLQEGMDAVFYYRTDVPAPLIYPPRYQAAVVVVPEENENVAVGYFDEALINEERTLQLNLNGQVNMRTANNQQFIGSPAYHSLVVTYRYTTRSIPAQTTPEKIVVLCK